MRRDREGSTGTRALLLAAATVLVAALLLPSPPPPAAQEPLPPPQWLGTVDMGGKVGLKWIHEPRYRAVRILRRALPGDGRFEPLGETAEAQFIDTGVVRGGTYVYRLVGVDSGGRESLPSQDAKILVAAPRPPSAPRWSGYLFVPGGVGLKWESKESEKVIAYNVYRRRAEAGDFSLLASSMDTSYRDLDLEEGAEYLYAVTALGADFQESPLSAPLTVRYAPPRVDEAQKEMLQWKARRTRLVRLLSNAKKPFFRPVDVAVGPQSGRVYLADGGNGEIHVFTDKGVYLRSMGFAERNGGVFRNLLGITVDSDERIYAVDGGRGAVVVLDRTGTILQQVLVGAFFPGPELGLIDIAVDGGQRWFVVDNLNSRILLRDPAKGWSQVGGPGREPGLFSAPAFGAVDAAGSLYVAEALNGRVQVFDAAGDFVMAIGKPARGAGVFARAKGVAVGADGEIYVADSYQNVIQAFAADGAFLGVLTDEAGRPLDLGSPNGIALDGERRIYIAERLSNRLQVREIIDEK